MYPMQTPRLILFLLPTCSCPALVEHFPQSVVGQSTCPDAVEIVLYVDEDDFESHRLDNTGIRIG